MADEWVWDDPPPPRTPGKDLGTYFLLAEFKNLPGFIREYHTGYWIPGSSPYLPDAKIEPPIYEDEAELIHLILFDWLDNNFSCDCNRILQSEMARGAKYEDVDVPCRDTIELLRLTLIKPDASRQVIWEAPDEG